MKKLIFILIAIVFVSCEQDLAEADVLGENAEIIGTWIEDGYKDDLSLFERAEKLDLNKYGFTIGEDGSFIENKNSGWCGTPPISYASYDGQWLALSDSLLEITVGYWGGTMTYQIRIVSLDSENLGIRYLYSEDRAPAR